MKGKNTQDDTGVNMYAWLNSSTAQRAAKCVNVTLIFCSKALKQGVVQRASFVQLMFLYKAVEILNNRHSRSAARNMQNKGDRS